MLTENDGERQESRGQQDKRKTNRRTQAEAQLQVTLRYVTTDSAPRKRQILWFKNKVIHCFQMKHFSHRKERKSEERHANVNEGKRV